MVGVGSETGGVLERDGGGVLRFLFFSGRGEAMVVLDCVVCVQF
jgi:hypothetical protein